jgi:hypothetical protein
VAQSTWLPAIGKVTGLHDWVSPVATAGMLGSPVVWPAWSLQFVTSSRLATRNVPFPTMA